MGRPQLFENHTCIWAWLAVLVYNRKPGGKKVHNGSKHIRLNYLPFQIWVSLNEEGWETNLFLVVVCQAVPVPILTNWAWLYLCDGNKVRAQEHTLDSIDPKKLPEDNHWGFITPRLKIHLTLNTEGCAMIVTNKYTHIDVQIVCRYQSHLLT